MQRRHLLFSAAAPFLARAAKVSSKERIDKAIVGANQDRPPFCFWHHFKLEKEPPIRHAKATLEFQRQFSLDLVKVMSDFPCPKGAGKQWYELKPVESPFPAQLEALRLIREGLKGEKYYVETIFNSFNQATKISSKEAVLELMRTKPQALLDALDAITKSQAAHARAAIAGGAAGIFLAIDNALPATMTREEYLRFSAPFDRQILEAVRGAHLNIMHLHGDRVYLDLFWKGWPATGISYDSFGTGVSIAAARKQYAGVLMAGLNHTTTRTDPPTTLRAAINAARPAAPKWILAPGCSVPDESTDAELLKLTKACST